MQRHWLRFIPVDSRHRDSSQSTSSPRLRPIVVLGSVPRRVRKAVAAALVRQSEAVSANTVKVGDDGRYATLRVPDDLREAPPPPSDEVIHPMGRRRQVRIISDSGESYSRSQLQLLTPPRIGLLRVLRRLLVWFNAILYFQLGNWYDVLRDRDSLDRRAVRLRRTFERVGGSFVKIGQQMASRLDLLPQRYCEELANMLDRYPPFPTGQAIAIIERTIGQSLQEIFSEFDPEPIGSASIAVVYQARLRKNGVKVAVKVRRPGIRELFEADFRALDFLGILAEALTLVRPGFSTYIRSEFRSVLTSELDFVREGRLGELFRRGARKANLSFVTAPEVYFEYSSDEVLVQEFIAGIWLWEILSALHNNDPAGLARIRDLNLDPKRIARRLLHTHYWCLYSHLAFHADPHPANIVVRANNEVVFIDFGASGHINNMRKVLFRRSYDSFLKNDPAAMAQAALILSEPLPPMDVNTVIKELEAAYHAHIIAVESKSSPWHERTSASLFIAAIKIMARHNIPAVPDFLMFARATLLYDTLAARLYPKINFYKEHQRFARKESRKIRKRARRSLRRRLRRGLEGSDYEMFEQALAVGGDLLFRTQRLLSLPYDFAVLPFMVEKWIFVVMMVIRFVARAALVTALGVGVVMGLTALNQQPVILETALEQVVQSIPYLVIVVLLALQHIRLILFRLEDKTRAD
jgi:ubiquinone biosynthesis protein